MIETLDDIEFETRMVGPMVLTTPVLRRLGLAEKVDRLCTIGEQADMGHGIVAELVAQCRLTESQAMYDMPDWAERYGLVGLYPELETEAQLKLFALAAGDGGLPVWADALSGGEGDSPNSGCEWDMWPNWIYCFRSA